jgi:hypothetical protein
VNVASSVVVPAARAGPVPPPAITTIVNRSTVANRNTPGLIATFHGTVGHAVVI